VALWDSDNLPDLIIGLADGRVAVHLNIGTLGAPIFDEGLYLQAGGVDLDVGVRATPSFVDWNDDDRRDLVVGGYDGRIHVFINTGADTAPVFAAETLAQTSEGTLMVSSNRASPILLDFNGNGLPDLIVGNTDGQLVAYINVGSAGSPIFGYFTLITSQGAAIDLAGSARSRPTACDWNADGELDLLVGGSDGRVHLYLGYEGNVVGVQGPVLVAHLQAPWPNPFNPAVNLACEFDVSTRATLTIHDVAGREVIRLFDGEMSSGRHQIRWHGRDRNGREQPTGIYFARLVSGLTRETCKLILLR